MALSFKYLYAWLSRVRISCIYTFSIKRNVPSAKVNKHFHTVLSLVIEGAKDAIRFSEDV